jgi:hypothetical protein
VTSRQAAHAVDGPPTASDREYFPPYRRGRRRGQDGYGGGLVALRAAFTTLARAPLGVLTGISVTLDLSGASDAAPRLLALCRALGEQYDLEVVPRLDGPTGEVRFIRRPVPGDQARGEGAATRTARRDDQPGGKRAGRSSDRRGNA